MSTLSPVIQHSLGNLIQHNKTGKKKGFQIGKKEVKLFLFSDDIILYLKDLENYQKKIPKCHKHLQQSSRMQNQFTKICTFLYTNNEHTEKEYMKTYTWNCHNETSCIAILNK
jgi:hypothetical protein